MPAPQQRQLTRATDAIQAPFPIPPTPITSLGGLEGEAVMAGCGSELGGAADEPAISPSIHPCVGADIASPPRGQEPGSIEGADATGAPGRIQDAIIVAVRDGPEEDLPPSPLDDVNFDGLLAVHQLGALALHNFIPVVADDNDDENDRNDRDGALGNLGLGNGNDHLDGLEAVGELLQLYFWLFGARADAISPISAQLLLAGAVAVLTLKAIYQVL
ncbi:hypothetical protein BOTBODRAFT_173822 [Botryobasidium botryosum FD-172 SS1]|uniref:Uncharacterized protein n=1 Tax=Botryobasidium botryosum (strain FD-172 SS1) TaxID=930990 RepID=A0A067MV67_BOTB1|nr:hypothetical protein BOTBODRAFT_173822 [Botryobasidium botryosum FD-172 SS1]